MGDRGYEAFGGRKGIVGMAPEGRADVLAARVRRAVERRKARVIYPRFYKITRCFPRTTRFVAWLAGPNVRDEAKARAAAQGPK
jgi:hypothetical protein